MTARQRLQRKLISAKQRRRPLARPVQAVDWPAEATAAARTSPHPFQSAQPSAAEFWRVPVMRIYGLLGAVVVSAVALGLGIPQGHANIFNADATWSSPTVGYATNIEPNDQSGSYLGEQIEFSSSAFLPHPMSVYVDTPNFGDITLNFTSIVGVSFNSAGEFYEMAGTDSAGGLDLLTAVIAPAHGILRFEVEGYGFGDLPPPPPPPCSGCNPPPCLTCATTHHPHRTRNLHLAYDATRFRWTSLRCVPQGRPAEHIPMTTERWSNSLRSSQLTGG